VSDQDSGFDALTWLFRLVRFLLAAAAVGISLAAAWYVRCWAIAKGWTGQANAMALVSVIATFKEFLTQVPKFLKFLWTGVGESVYQLSVFLFIAATTLAVLSLPGSEPSTGQSNGPFYSVAFINSGSSGSTAPADGSNAFEIPFVEPTQCPTAGDWGAGTDLVSNAQTFIGNLARGLSACTTNGKKVTILVRGYASSQTFLDDHCGKDFEALNLRLANDRAHAVAGFMRKKLTGAMVTVKDDEWLTAPAMREGMGLNDKRNDKPDKERAYFTRRVDVIVKDAGDCAVASGQGGSPAQ
jgi:hypothetical protein